MFAGAGALYRVRGEGGGGYVLDTPSSGNIARPR